MASTAALRALAAAITLSSFGGMTVFASANLHVSNAPLQPAAASMATPAPTTAPMTQVGTTRTTVSSSVTSTSATAVTRTKQS